MFLNVRRLEINLGPACGKLTQTPVMGSECLLAVRILDDAKKECDWCWRRWRWWSFIKLDVFLLHSSQQVAWTAFVQPVSRFHPQHSCTDFSQPTSNNIRSGHLCEACGNPKSGPKACGIHSEQWACPKCTSLSWTYWWIGLTKICQICQICPCLRCVSPACFDSATKWTQVPEPQHHSMRSLSGKESGAEGSKGDVFFKERSKCTIDAIVLCNHLFWKNLSLFDQNKWQI